LITPCSAQPGADLSGPLWIALEDVPKAHPREQPLVSGVFERQQARLHPGAAAVVELLGGGGHGPSLLVVGEGRPGLPPAAGQQGKGYESGPLRRYLRGGPACA
jgi:hypothetical protein